MTQPQPILCEGFQCLVRGRHGLTLFNKNDVYIGRSLDLYGEYSEGEVELFDPALEQWETLGSLPQPEAYIATVLLADDRVWITGGQSGQNAAIFWADTWLVAVLPAAP